MANVFLLTGPPRMGKSTAVQRIIRLIGAERCGGFCTEEIRAADERTGFKCVTLDGREAVIAHVGEESPLRIGRYGVNLDRFEAVGLDALGRAMTQSSVVVVDEIGFMQLESARFRDMVRELVGGNGIVIGTIYADERADFDWVKSAEGVKLFTLTAANRDAVPGIVADEVLRLLR